VRNVREVRLTPNQWAKAAETIAMDFANRANSMDRLERARIWKEVDRQVDMIPKPKKHVEGDKDDWLPNTELPLQASALEVLQADARQLTFPRDNKWFLPHSDLSDKFITRWNNRRETMALIGDKPAAVELKQEQADVLVKAVMNKNHKNFKFRRAVEAFDIDALKYGTYGGKVIKAEQPSFDGTFSDDTAVGVAVVPISAKNLYLDTRVDQMTLEGQFIAPSPMREFWKSEAALKIAAKEDKTFIQMSKLDADKDAILHIVEFEGDLIIPTSRETLFVPNMTIWVVISGAGSPLVVRSRKNEFGFRSLITGVYMRDNLNSPYGSSPLMKGQPIQELATELTNNMATAAALSALPPTIYDDTNVQLKKQGGPNLFPGAHNPVDDIDTSIRIMSGWKIGEIQAALFLALQQYEDLTGVTAPRRGAAAKSHTTAFAAEVESVRGLVRTDDYVQAKEKEVLRPILQMEYAIIKKVMKKQSVFVNAAGMEGYVTLAKEDLPDHVEFEVVGSSGPLTERQKQEQQLGALQNAAAFDLQSQQTGAPPMFNREEALKELLNVFANPERFINQPQSAPQTAPGEQGISGVVGSISGPSPAA